MSVKVIINIIKDVSDLYYNDVKVLKVTADFPEFEMSEPTPGIKWINEYYLKRSNNFWYYIKFSLTPEANIQYKKTIAENEGLSPEQEVPLLAYEVVLKFQIPYQDSCTASLYYDEYTFTGGAHGNTIRKSDTWNLTNGYAYQLKDFFPIDLNYRTYLIDLILEQISDQIAAGNTAYFDNYQELVRKTFSPENFYLKPEGLVIYFQQYDIAPYYAGIVEFLIPFQLGGAQLPEC